MGQWGKLFVEGGHKLGQTFSVVPDGLQKKAMEEAGFEDIKEWDFNVRVPESILTMPMPISHADSVIMIGTIGAVA